jgi:hypothetical protein
MAKIEAGYEVCREHGLVLLLGRRKGFENEWANGVARSGVKYEDYYCSIIVLLTIILFGNPSIHNAKLLLILVLRRLIYVCGGTPTNFVPVWNRTSLCGR